MHICFGLKTVEKMWEYVVRMHVWVARDCNLAKKT